MKFLNRMNNDPPENERMSPKKGPFQKFDESSSNHQFSGYMLVFRWVNPHLSLEKRGNLCKPTLKKTSKQTKGSKHAGWIFLLPLNEQRLMLGIKFSRSKIASKVWIDVLLYYYIILHIYNICIYLYIYIYYRIIGIS